MTTAQEVFEEWKGYSAEKKAAYKARLIELNNRPTIAERIAEREAKEAAAKTLREEILQKIEAAAE